MSVAHYEYWKMWKRKTWATPASLWYVKRGDRYDKWTPAKPTKLLRGRDADPGNTLIDIERNEREDLSMMYLIDARKEWKICNSATQRIFWKSIGWL